MLVGYKDSNEKEKETRKILQEQADSKADMSPAGGYAVTTRRMQLMSEPSGIAKVLCTVKAGTSIIIIDYEPDGKYVFVELEDGTRGYLYSQFVEE